MVVLVEKAPEARLDYRMGRRGWAQAPPTPAGAACAARPAQLLLVDIASCKSTLYTPEYKTNKQW